MSQDRRGPGKPTAEKARMADDIRSQLVLQGGAAHRDVVIGKILQTRRVKDGPAAERARRLALRAFELHRVPPPESGVAKLFHLPFGEDSRRWALDREA